MTPQTTRSSAARRPDRRGGWFWSRLDWSDVDLPATVEEHDEGDAVLSASIGGPEATHITATMNGCEIV